MSKFPYLPLCVDAYRNDTPHLSLEEHGAYLTLIMLAWRSPGCRLPADDVKLARMLGITGKKWASLKPSVMAFWVCADGFWSQGRLAKEHEYVSRKSEQNRNSGAKGGAAKSLNQKEQALANATATATANALPPNTLHLTPEKKDNPQDPNGSYAPKGAKRSDRGSFLDRDWTPSETDWAFARAELGDDLSVAREREKFRNYWFSKSGADGRKRDWSATWRNWIMRAAENGKRSSDLFPGSPSFRGSPRPQQSAAAAAVARHADRERIRSGGWSDDPRSGDAGGRRSSGDDPEIPDAEWTAAGRYSAAH